MATDVFISYARVDLKIADSIASALVDAGLETWWDHRLLPGEVFDRQIQRAIDGAKVIVGIISPRSLRSPWVRWELSQAHDNELVVVPVLVDGVQPEDLPAPLRSVHALVLGGDPRASIQRVSGSIRTLVKKVESGSIGRNDATTLAQQREARRRLAHAAAETARQAADIKRSRARLDLPATSIRSQGEPTAETTTCFSMSDGLLAFLDRHDIALAFTSFQTGQLFFLGRGPKGAVLNQQNFRKPTGLYLAGETLLLCTLSHVYRMENVLGPRECIDDVFTRCYLPRTGHFTGVLDAHDIAVTGAGDVVFVNTAYNCLAGISATQSFRFLWKPPFVSEIVAQDRCHLNGLAMREGRPAFVSAVAPTDSVDAWRDVRADGGVVVDVNEGRVVCDGLSMPHSPRVYEDRIWVLNSGAGELGFVEGAEGGMGAFRPTAFLPGFVRGLTFHGHHAFVGLSRPRHESFEDLPLDRRLREVDAEAWSGIAIVDLRTGGLVEWLRIEGEVRELYDVAVLPGAFAPMSLGFMSHDAPGPITIEY